MAQESLDLFDGKKVELTSVKFVGDPDRIIEKNEHGSNVAYLVLGSTDAVAFSANQDQQIVRDEKCKMRRVLQIDYSEAVSMLDEFDRKAHRITTIGTLTNQQRFMPNPNPGSIQILTIFGEKQSANGLRTQNLSMT